MTKDIDDRPRSKVGKLIAEYDLKGLGLELETRWTANDGERMSLRELADYFNKQLLAAALRDVDQTALDRDVEKLYQNMTEDSISSGVRTDTLSTLSKYGIDTDNLRSDFVSYQAIRTYLKEWRGVEYDSLSAEEKRAKDRRSIQRLLTKSLSVAEDRLEKLRRTDRIRAEEFEVFVDANVLCKECGTRYTVSDFIINEGCSCLQDQ